MTMGWLVMGALAATALVVELVRRATRKAPSDRAEKITSKP
jgi:hypothetical protein